MSAPFKFVLPPELSAKEPPERRADYADLRTQEEFLTTDDTDFTDGN
jgi:hypothetical protein